VSSEVVRRGLGGVAGDARVASQRGSTVRDARQFDVKRRAQRVAAPDDATGDCSGVMR
jgi:hypothetical protein